MDFLIPWPQPFTTIYICIEILGLLSCLHAIMRARTSQAAVAWSLALLLMPLMALPIYWTLGRSRFYGYVNLRRSRLKEIEHIKNRILSFAPQSENPLSKGNRGDYQLLEELAALPISSGNEVHLLINGSQTFESIFDSIRKAKEYVLVQFYIVREDHLGTQLKDLLIQKAQEGVRVCFLMDKVGSLGLTKAYFRSLHQAGVQVHVFKSSKGWESRFQINFRNHRKIVITDGRLAFVGGHNVGDEYLGKNPNLSPWRDTHVCLEGPAVKSVQLAFIEDWFWVTGEVLHLDWTMHRSSSSDKNVLVIPSGPSDYVSTSELFYVAAIHRAQKRVWISSPYFVPDASVISALQVASMRGVDVRIMLPQKPDHLLVQLAAFSFLNDMENTSVEFYKYQKGFLHQKAMLVDNDLSAVGTVNLDNRSFRLNFEINVVTLDKEFGKQVEEMFLHDFSCCKRFEPSSFYERGRLFHLLVQMARLFSPIL